MRRVNILADKSLLSAFVENTHNIEVRHVQAAIRDSELASRRISANSKRLAVTGILAAFAGILIGIGVFTGYTNSDSSSGVPIPSKEINQAITAAPEPVSAVLAVSAVATAVSVASTSSVPAISSPAPIHEAETVDKSKSVSTIHAAKAEKATPDKAESILSLKKTTNPAPLLKQRLQATRKAIKSNKGGIGVQLFYTNDVRPEHMEQFLVRAKKLDTLKDIYILPISINGNEGYRVLCGIYPDSESASAGIEKLPKRYKEAFAPALYIIPSMNTP
jgi:septal ring-binding cell division protein DamX